MAWLTQATASPVSPAWDKKPMLWLLPHNSILLQGWSCSTSSQRSISGYLWCWRQGQLIWPCTQNTRVLNFLMFLSSWISRKRGRRGGLSTISAQLLQKNLLTTEKICLLLWKIHLCSTVPQIAVFTSDVQLHMHGLDDGEKNQSQDCWRTENNMYLQDHYWTQDGSDQSLHVSLTPLSCSTLS